MKINDIMRLLLQCFVVVSFDNGVGRFDSDGGTYDEQTSFDFFTQLYYQSRPRSLVANLASTAGGIDQLDAFPGANISSVIDRQEITSGDMVRFTMEDNIRGRTTYGDYPIQSGGFLSFKNLECRVNSIHSPAIQIVGEQSQARVRKSIADLPAETRRAVIDFMAEQDEFEVIPALLQGASPAALKGLSDGGLAVSLGIGSGAGAGVPLMNKHWFTPDTGFCTYSTTPATYNSTVNDAINGIDAAAADCVTLAFLDMIRAKMDTEYFNPVTINGRRVKAAAGCDPDVMWRIKGLFADWNKYAMPRGNDNPFWSTQELIVYNEVMYFSWPNLKKYRPAYNATTVRPDFGPVTAETDPRAYTTTSTNGLIVFMGAGALKEGYRASIEVMPEYGRFKQSMEIAASKQAAWIRGEWYTKDGRADSTDNVENRSVICAAFYEPGVGVTPT